MQTFISIAVRLGSLTLIYTSHQMLIIFQFKFVIRQVIFWTYVSIIWVWLEIQNARGKQVSFSLLISLVLPPAAMGYRNDFGRKASKIVLRNQISNKCFHLFKPSQHLSLYRQTDICWLRHYAEGSFVSLLLFFYFWNPGTHRAWSEEFQSEKLHK